MPVDERLLAEAQRAAGRITQAQREVDVARAAFQRAVRALYLEGGSLREIADRLSLSHQRVHQLLDLPTTPPSGTADTSGMAGTKPTKKRGRRGAAPCSFCGRTQAQVGKLITGSGGVAICNDCVELGTTVLRHHAPATDARVTMATQVDPGRCPFCGDHSNPVQPGVSSRGSHDEPAGQDDELDLIIAPGTSGAICSECLELCIEIVGEFPQTEMTRE